MKSDEDAIHVDNFKNGDEKAFDHLYNRYHISVYTLCYRYSRNEADARELTQDVFLKVYRKLHNFQGRSKFFTWLYRITVNTCLSFQRSSKQDNRAVQIPRDHPGLGKRIRMKVAIDRALLKLPKRQKLCFVLHHYNGYTFAEIGDIMKITTGAAKANHFHAVRKLRIMLKDWL
jgi:RNA polymerase sigma-70 factor (ECF subfamily)